ncbi:hypothetical protein GGF46_000538 [Coemansia sp. RSA 552]|nr:hypothetical protein GGF46_000538 [Coemansia sp. RSA 552]
MLTTRFMNGNYTDEYDPTIEDSYRKQCTVDDMTCVVEILDTAGQEEYAAMRDYQIRSGDCFVVVYSITDVQSLHEAEIIAKKIFLIKETRQVPIVLVGNKCDLTTRQVATKTGMELARSLHSGFYESSARENIKVDAIFAQCIRRMKRLQMHAALRTEGRSSLYQKHGKSLAGTRSWIPGLRSKDKTESMLPTHQSLPDHAIGTYTSVQDWKQQQRSQTEPIPQPTKRKTTGASDTPTSSKRRSTGRSDGLSGQDIVATPSGFSYDIDRAVPLARSVERRPTPDSGYASSGKNHSANRKRSTKSKHGYRSRVDNSSSRSPPRHHDGTHSYRSRNLDMNKDKELPPIGKRRLRGDSSCTIL